jgi:Na+-translocating ferredoxin:NAD+ oxidoreductase RNF subunit RnfB
MNVVMAVVIVATIGLIGASILVAASRFLSVEVDGRVAQALGALPGANCGACGYAGCADYAQAVVEGAEPNLCVPGGAAAAAGLAAIMGVDAGVVVQRKAIVACQGTLEYAPSKYEYEGLASCAANATLHGGVSSCIYGCLGFGDCAAVCKFNAIDVHDGLARVNPVRCTGCGACLEACPKKVIWIREVSEKPVVMCANHHRGAETRKECTAGCISCMKCQKVCPTGAVAVRGNVARIDLDKCIGCRACVNNCPVKAIAIPKVV